MTTARPFLALAVAFSLVLLIARCGDGIGTTKFGTTCPLGATFENIDDFLYTANRGSFAMRIRFGSDSNFYVVGRGVANDNADHWIVRRGKNRGATWTTLDDYVYPAGTGAAAADSIVTPTGNIFVVGYGISGVTPRWIVRRSTDAGVTWTTVDDFEYAVGQQSQATSVTSASDGTLYVAGFGTDGTTRWIVRKSANNGGSWTTIDDFEFAASQNARANSIAIELTNVVYVVGRGADGTNTYWLTRRSINDGASWTTVDSFLLGSGITASASDISFNGTKAVFVAGTASDGTLNHGITRMSETNGASWTTADNFQLSDTTNASFNAMASDPAGSPFTVGVGGSLGGGSDHWVVRRSIAGTGWFTFDDFRYPPGEFSQANGIAFDPDGAAYVSGSALDPSVDRWVVRKVSCD